jgi:uncharacterized protein YbaP (TraB family)
MLKFLPRVLTAFALFAAPAALAQEAKDADPALWVVKDADTTIYLFGTVHVLKPGLSWFDEGVKAAFDKSDELVLEMIEPDAAAMQGLIMKTALNMTGPTLTEKLPADKREAFGKALADVGVPAAALDRVDPWFAAVTLTMAGLPKLGYDPASGAERALAVAAKAANKQLIGLETAEEQLGFFDGLPEPLQLAFLVSTIDDYSKMGAQLDKMVASWSAGDPEALGRVMNEELSDTPEIAKVLLADRNARWAEWIGKRLEKPGTIFVAVGAGHLAGTNSVQDELARHKLAATRVAY